MLNRLILALTLAAIANVATAADKPTKASSTDWWSLKPLVRPAVPHRQSGFANRKSD